MSLGGGYDMSVYERFQPFFWGLFVDGRLVGCNSCHKSSPLHMRSRGLFIHEEFRGRGYSRSLFAAVERTALQKGCDVLWSYPRQSAFEVYRKFGFMDHSASAESPDHRYVWKQLDPFQRG